MELQQPPGAATIRKGDLDLLVLSERDVAAALDGRALLAALADGFRAAGSAVVSIEALARPDARVVTLVGAGVQGREHLALLPLARPFEEIQVASLHHADAVELATSRPRAVAVDDLEAAVRRSDV